MIRASIALSSVLFLLSCGGQPRPTTCTSDAQCAPNKCCGGKCVDVQTSLTHCGACSNFCSTVHGAATCTSGVCGITCATGFGDCNQMVKDGCETNLTESVNNCGTCANLCLAANADVFCERSECLQSGCFAGWGDCNGMKADGCETNTKSSNAHCGGCNKKCEVSEGTGACEASACTVAACNPGFGDCDLSATTGCETDLRVSLDHCGVCGMACTAGYKCKVGKCVAPELVFFGGRLNAQSSGMTDAVSAFNVDSHTWTTVPTGGADKPGPRASHLAVWDAVTNQMLVWGGITAGGTAVDTFVWALDFNGDPDGGTVLDGGGVLPEWRKLTAAGTGPANRNGFAYAYDKASRRIYLYGGTDSNNNFIYNELWQFDVPTKTWTQRTESGGPFDGRYLTAGGWDVESKRFVFGSGYDDNFFSTNDFYAFDPAADGGNFTLIPSSGAPQKRTGAVFLGDAVPLHFYGGFDDFGDTLGDLYKLSLTDAGIEWSRQSPTNDLTARGYATAASTVDRRFLFGGISYVTFPPITQTEVWEYSTDAGWALISDGGTTLDDGGTSPVHPGAVNTSAVARE